MKKMGTDLFTEKSTGGVSGPVLDYSIYSVKLIQVPIEIFVELDITLYIRICCNIPIKYENLDIDYYEHLELYKQNTFEHDVKDSGELCFAFNCFLENYEEADFEYFCKACQVYSELPRAFRLSPRQHRAETTERLRVDNELPIPGAYSDKVFPARLRQAVQPDHRKTLDV